MMVRRVGVDAALALTLSGSLLAGFGNVLFSAHSGSPLGLAAVRFAFGLLIASVWVWFRGGAGRLVRSRLRLLAATAGGASPLLLMHASDYLSTGMFTLVVASAPLFSFALAPLFGFARPARRATSLVAVAFVFASAAALSSAPEVSASAFGLLLAAGSACCLSVSILAVARMGRMDVARLLVDVCAAGLLLSLLLVPAVDFAVSSSTVVAALLVALFPGGLAKVAMFYAAPRTSPQLVAAGLTVSVVSASFGGWLLLAEPVTLSAAAFGGVALVALLALPFVTAEAASPSGGVPPAGR